MGSSLRFCLGFLAFKVLNAEDGSNLFQVAECWVIFRGIVEALSDTVLEIVNGGGFLALADYSGAGIVYQAVARGILEITR